METASRTTSPELQALLDRIVEAASHDDKAAMLGWFDRLRHLGQSEQDLLVRILTDIRDKGESNLLHALRRLDFERDPVSIDEFLENNYYLGEVGPTVYPTWREDLRYVCNPASGIYEWILTGSIGAGKCVSRDVLLQTDQGLLYPTEVCEGMTLLSEAGPRRVTAKFVEGKKASLRIVTKSGAWDENTPHHRHRVLTPDFEIVWKPNDALRPGDFLVRKPGHDALWGPSTLSPEICTILGLWVAEGHYTPGKQIRFCSGLDDAPEVEALLAASGLTWVPHKDCREKLGLWAITGPLAEGIHVEMPTGSEHKRIPSFIRGGSQAMVVAFLRGYFGGDGGVSGNSIEATTKSERLAWEIHALLWALGIKAQVRTKTIRSGPYAGRRYSVVAISDKWAKIRFRDKVGFCFQRKVDALAGICDETKGHHDNDREVIPFASRAVKESYGRIPANYRSKTHPIYQRLQTIYVAMSGKQAVTRKAVQQAYDSPYGPDHLHPLLRRIIEEGLVFDEVVSVTPGEAEMYDFTVDGDHSYVANGFISHNTYVSLIAQLYRGPYYLSCMRNPQTYFGLAPGTEIAFGVFNATRENAASIDFAQFIRFIDRSPYFRECMPRGKRSDYIQFPSKDITIKEGSRGAHALGANLFGYMIDEANFMQTPSKPNEVDAKEKDQAYQLFEHTRRRMESRFLRFGVNPGLACIVSSRKAQSSFLENHMKEVKENRNVHVSDYALWDVKGRDTYDARTFRVAIGNTYRNTRILDVVDGVSKNVTAKEDPPEGQEILNVPVDFYDSFKRDPDGSLRDVAGIPTFSMRPLIHNVEAVHACVNRNRAHPFISDEAILPLNDPGCDLIKLMKWRDLVYVDRSAYRLRVRPAEPRVIHVDIGVTGDACGIAMGHRFESYTKHDYDPHTGEVRESLHPRVWMDFMLRIRTTQGTQIDITKIVAFILNLRNFGIPLVKATFDGYQSTMAVQILQKAAQLPQEGYAKMDPLADIGAFQGAGIFSVDKDDRAYTMLRDVITYQALDFYPYMPFVQEVLHLEHDRDKKKVDHPKNGSKDVSDAVAGVCYNLLTLTLPQAPPPESSKSIPQSIPLHDQMLMGIAGDAIAHDRIQGIVPAPNIAPAVPPGRSAPPGRSMSSGMSDLISRIALQGR